MDRSEGRAAGSVRPRKAVRWRHLGCGCPLFAKDAEVRLGLRTVVEAEHGDDVALQFGWKKDVAVTNAIGLPGDARVRQRDAERPLHVRDAAGKLDGPPSGRRRAGLNLQAELLGEPFHQHDRGGIGRVICSEFRSRQALPAADIRGGKRRLAPNDDGHCHLSAGSGGFLLDQLRGRRFLAAG